jgi:hypothetical protein
VSAGSFLELPSRLPLFTSNQTRVILPLSLRALFPEGAKLMEWTTPKHEEIDLNCEVGSYANAEL